jgi:release factor glutamine methyltransferase
MTLEEYLKNAIAALAYKEVETARLDSLVLLEDVTGKERGWLLAHPDYELTSLQVNKLTSWVKRRAKHEPLAYIHGKAEFYGREFFVNKDVLVPRPETEDMISLLCKQVADSRYQVSDGLRIVDVGTGSGCIAVTAKLEFPGAEVHATEISAAAVKTAKQNAKKHNVDVEFHKGNLLQPLPATRSPLPITFLLCNLPYVPDDYPINKAAENEPKLALFAGKDGLGYYRKLFSTLPGMPAYILTESLPQQHKALEVIAEENGYWLDRTQDLVQLYSIA